MELDPSELVDINGMGSNGQEQEEEYRFEYAEDLVRYIGKEYGGWFCVGVAGENQELGLFWSKLDTF